MKSEVYEFIFETLLIVIIGICFLVRSNKKIYRNKLQELNMNASQYELCKKHIQEHFIKKTSLPKNNELLKKYLEWWWKHNKDLAYVESDSLIVSCICIAVFGIYELFYSSNRLIHAYESLGMLFGLIIIIACYVYSIGSFVAYLLGTRLFNGEMYCKTVRYWLNIVLMNIGGIGLFYVFLQYS